MTFIPVGTAINLLLTASLRTGILIWSPGMLSAVGLGDVPAWATPFQCAFER